MKCLIVFVAVIAAVRAGFPLPVDHLGRVGGVGTGISHRTRVEDGFGGYKFGYDEKHETGGTFRKEYGVPGMKVGSYGIVDADGRQRIVSYVADEGGFRADIKTNEPGVGFQDPAATVVNKEKFVTDPTYPFLPGHVGAHHPAPVLPETFPGTFPSTLPAAIPATTPFVPTYGAIHTTPIMKHYGDFVGTPFVKHDGDFRPFPVVKHYGAHVATPFMKYGAIAHTPLFGARYDGFGHSAMKYGMYGMPIDHKVGYYNAWDWNKYGHMKYGMGIATPYKMDPYNTYGWNAAVKMGMYSDWNTPYKMAHYNMYNPIARGSVISHKVY